MWRFIAQPRRHGISEDDIDHAYRRAIMWVELGDDPPRYLVVDPDRSGTCSSWS